MNTILVMNLTGTSVWFGYLLLCKAMKGRMSARLKYVLVRINILVFLIPLYFLGDVYHITVAKYTPYTTVKNRYTPKDMIWMKTDTGGYAASLGLRMELLVVAVYGFLAVLMICCWLICDWKMYRMMAQAIHYGSRQEDPLQEELAARYHIRRKVETYICEKDTAAFTLGVLKPVMVYRIPEEQTEHELLLSHELCHVRRHDAIWQVLGDLAKGLNFWNPCVYFLRKELERACELSCDEWVIRDRDLSQRAVYARMLVDHPNFLPWMEKGVVTTLGVKKRHGNSKLKERVVSVMEYDQRKNKKVAGVILATCMLAVCSFTTFAYEHVAEMPVDKEEIEKLVNGSDLTIVIYEKGQEDPMAEDEDIILYPVQYMDSQGNIYPLENFGDSDTAEPDSVCLSHIYEDVTISEHTRNADGSCITIQFSAKRCTKCGKIKNRVLINETVKKYCPH